MKVLFLVILIITFFAINRCEKDRSIERISLVNIETSILPDTLLVNEIAAATIKASAGDGCWSNLYVDFKKTDTYVYSIKAYGTFTCFEGGCACPAVMVYLDTIIDFQFNQRGTYIFHIQKNRFNITTDTLIVK